MFIHGHVQVVRMCTGQWRIQDFPQGVRQLPKLLLFFKFLPKMKEFGPGGGARAPL